MEIRKWKKSEHASDKAALTQTQGILTEKIQNFEQDHTEKAREKQLIHAILVCNVDMCECLTHCSSSNQFHFCFFCVRVSMKIVEKKNQEANKN